MAALVRARLQNMNAFITGAGGFLGRALSEHLQRAGAAVAGLDERAMPAALPDGTQYHQTSILDFKALYDALGQFPPDNAVVFHLAGQAHVSQSRTDPLTSISVNVTGTANLLEACRRLGVSRVIFPSTALVYARPLQLPVEETAAVRANSVYAATKLAGEALLQGYASEYGFACRIARLGNVYGPGGAIDSVVQIVLRQVKAGGPISIKTFAPVRDFVYRDDVVRGMIALASRTDEPGCEVFNLSSGTATTMRELVELACRISGLKTDISETEPGRDVVQDALVLSIQRIRRYAEWQPDWRLEDGLRQTLSQLELSIE